MKLLHNFCSGAAGFFGAIALAMLGFGAIYLLFCLVIVLIFGAGNR